MMRPTRMLLCALGAVAQTTYPYTYTNCGVEHTISAAPNKSVTMNQGMTEFMLAMGLQDHMAGTAYLDDSIWPRYAAEYKSCAMRRQILQHELDELAGARAEAARRAEAAALAGERLADERDATRRRLDELRAELALVERHVAEQLRKRDEQRAAADELDRKIAMVGETIAGLGASMDRAQVLAESIDPHLDLSEDDAAR